MNFCYEKNQNLKSNLTSRFWRQDENLLCEFNKLLNQVFRDLKHYYILNTTTINLSKKSIQVIHTRYTLTTEDYFYLLSLIKVEIRSTFFKVKLYSEETDRVERAKSDWEYVSPLAMQIIFQYFIYRNFLEEWKKYEWTRQMNKSRAKMTDSLFQICNTQ